MFELKSLTKDLEFNKIDSITQKFRNSEKALKIYLIILALKKEEKDASVTIERIKELTFYDEQLIRRNLELFRQIGLMRKHTVKQPHKYIILENFNEFQKIAEKEWRERNGIRN